jgi:Phosphotransferase enzyme family
VVRVPLVDGVAWFKACPPAQRRLTAELFARWPDRVAEVLGHDEERAWLLLADAGTPIGVFGNPPEAWLVALPLYAELQRGEVPHTHDHLTHGVPDLRVATLPALYEDLLRHDLPLARDEIGRLRGFAAGYAELCVELAAHGVPETVQHDDLHMANLYARGEQLRLLDWGDASISHPFASLVVTFRFLEEIIRPPPGDPWFARLRDAYLEPWGRGLVAAFALAIRIGTFAHSIAWGRQRDHLPDEARAEFDRWFRPHCGVRSLRRSGSAARRPPHHTSRYLRPAVARSRFAQCTESSPRHESRHRHDSEVGRTEHYANRGELSENLFTGPALTV